MTLKELKTDLESSKTKVSKRNISRELHGNGIKSFTRRKTLMLTIKHVASLLNFARGHLEKGNEYWKTVIRSNETKIELFDCNAARHVWGTKATAYDRKNTSPTVELLCGNIMVWACFTSPGTGAPHIIDGKMDCIVKYWRGVSSRVRSVYSKNASGHSKKTTTSDYSKSPDLNPIDNLWGTRKNKIRQRGRKNLAELKEICIVEWADIS